MVLWRFVLLSNNPDITKPSRMFKKGVREERTESPATQFLRQYPILHGLRPCIVQGLARKTPSQTVFDRGSPGPSWADTHATATRFGGNRCAQRLQTYHRYAVRIRSYTVSDRVLLGTLPPKHRQRRCSIGEMTFGLGKLPISERGTNGFFSHGSTRMERGSINYSINRYP